MLEELAEDLRVVSKFKMGYPSSVGGVLYVKFTDDGVKVKKNPEEGYEAFLDHKALGIVPESLAGITINNVGSTFDQSRTRRMECKQVEQEVLFILADFFGIPKDLVMGYVTTGGSEGNFVSFWWSRKFLAAKNPPTARCALVTSSDSHYSVDKVADQLAVDYIKVPVDSQHQMDVEKFRAAVSLYLNQNPGATIMANITMGTTVHGASDDLNAIRSVLESLLDRNRFTIHLDAAILGITLPVLKPFGEAKNYLSDLGVDTLAVCAHKFFGIPQISGVVLTTRNFIYEAFGSGGHDVKYLDKVKDISFTGSRAGLNALAFYKVLLRLELHKDSKLLKSVIDTNLTNAKYLYRSLGEVFDQDQLWYTPNQFSVVFPKPSDVIMRKYHLMPYDNAAAACVMLNVNKELIDEFIGDVKLEMSFHRGVLIENKQQHERNIRAWNTCNIARPTVVRELVKFISSLPHSSYSQLTGSELEQVCMSAADSGICMIGRHPRAIVCSFFVEDYSFQLPFAPSVSPPPIKTNTNSHIACISAVCIRTEADTEWIVHHSMREQLRYLSHYGYKKVICNSLVHPNIKKILEPYQVQVEQQTLTVNLDTLNLSPFNVSQIHLPGVVKSSATEFEYAILSDEHVEQAASLLSDVFCRHGVFAKAMNIHPTEYQSFGIQIVRKAAKDQLSSVCIHKGKVVGLSLAEDNATPLTITEPIDPRFQTIGALLSEINERFIDSCTKHGLVSHKEYRRPPMVANIQFTATLDEYANYGIAREISRYNVLLLYQKGFQYISTTVTHPHSQKMLSKQKIFHPVAFEVFRYPEVQLQDKSRPFSNLDKFCTAWLVKPNGTALNRFQQRFQNRTTPARL